MHKWNNPQNVSEGQTEISMNSKEVLGPTHSSGHLFVLISENIKSKAPGRYSGGSFLKVNSSLRPSLHEDSAERVQSILLMRTC